LSSLKSEVWRLEIPVAWGNGSAFRISDKRIQAHSEVRKAGYYRLRFAVPDGAGEYLPRSRYGRGIYCPRLE